MIFYDILNDSILVRSDFIISEEGYLLLLTALRGFFVTGKNIGSMLLFYLILSRFLYNWKKGSGVK